MLQNMYWPSVLFGTAKRKGEWITAECRLAKRTLLGDFPVKAWKKYSSYPKNLKISAQLQSAGGSSKAWRSLFHEGEVREESLQTSYGWEIYSATPWPAEKMTAYTERANQSWVSHYEIMVMLRHRDKLPRCSQKKSALTCGADFYYTYHTDPQWYVPFLFYSKTAARSKCVFPHSKEIAFM